MSNIVSTNSLTVFLQTAEELSQQKRYEELHSACAQFLTAMPNSCVGLFFKAEALARLGRLEQSLPLYEQAARLFETDDNDELRAKYGARLLAAKKRAEAECSRPAIDLNSYQGFVSRAAAHLASDRAEEALEDFERALAINNKALHAHLNRFSILLRLDRPHQMLAAANDLLVVTPGQSIGYFYLGIAFSRLGRDEETIEAYTKAIELAPNDSSSFVNRGATYASLGHMEKALADCQEALSIKPGQVSALVNTALCLRTTGQPEEAIKVCDQTLAIDRDCALAYCNRGLANFILNRTSESLDDAELSIKLAKKPMYVAKCKCIKAKLLVAGGGGGDGKDIGGRIIEEARQLCDSAVRLAPENSHPWRYAWSTSALVSAMMGDFEAANQNAQLVLDRAQGFIYGINIKAQILLMQERLSEALVTVNSALALNGKDPESNYIRYQIRSRQEDPRACEDLTRARKLGYLRNGC